MDLAIDAALQKEQTDAQDEAAPERRVAQADRAACPRKGPKRCMSACKSSRRKSARKPFENFDREWQAIADLASRARFS